MTGAPENGFHLDVIPQPQVTGECIALCDPDAVLGGGTARAVVDFCLGEGVTDVQIIDSEDGQPQDLVMRVRGVCSGPTLGRPGLPGIICNMRIFSEVRDAGAGHE